MLSSYLDQEDGDTVAAASHALQHMFRCREAESAELADFTAELSYPFRQVNKSEVVSVHW